MNKRMIMLMAAALALLSASGQMEFTGVMKYSALEEIPDNTPDLNKIYVLYDTEGVGMSFPSMTGTPAVWKIFDLRGGGFADTIAVDWDGYSTTLKQVIPDRGYSIIEKEGAKPFNCWVVDYSKYMISLNDVFWEDDLMSKEVTLKIDGTAPAILYTLNGRKDTVNRKIELEYETLVWNENELKWQPQHIEKNLKSLGSSLLIDMPLCDTQFHLKGDQFLKRWRLEEEEVWSRDYVTQAVDCRSTAVQERESHTDNPEAESEESQEGLGGSAPVRIVFTGYPSSKEKAVYRVWEFASDPDFEDVTMQFFQDELDYTFDESGTYYVRYRINNAEGTCEAMGDTYEVTIDVSEMPYNYEVPNFFSPGSITPRFNDIWMLPQKKIKSIVEFHCWIFNRWGTLLYEFTDPAGGWDGTYRGQFVGSGVYYYVVTATGSEGKKYTLRGDINILGSPRGDTAPQGDGAGGGGGFE